MQLKINKPKSSVIAAPKAAVRLTKSVSSKVVTPKLAVLKAKIVAPKVAAFPERPSIQFIVDEFIAKGLDGLGAWLTSTTRQDYLKSLHGQGVKLSSQRVARISGKALLVQTPDRVFAEKLTGLSGDTYEFAHKEPRKNNKMFSLRGSLALLRTTYGKGASIAVVPIDAAIKAVKNMKGGQHALANLGVAAAK